MDSFMQEYQQPSFDIGGSPSYQPQRNDIPPMPQIDPTDDLIKNLERKVSMAKPELLALPANRHAYEFDLQTLNRLYQTRGLNEQRAAVAELKRQEAAMNAVKMEELQSNAKMRKLQMRKAPSNALMETTGGNAWADAGTMKTEDGKVIHVPMAGTVTPKMYGKLDKYMHGDRLNAPLPSEFNYAAPKINTPQDAINLANTVRGQASMLQNPADAIAESDKYNAYGINMSNNLKALEAARIKAKGEQEALQKQQEFATKNKEEERVNKRNDRIMQNEQQNIKAASSDVGNIKKTRKVYNNITKRDEEVPRPRGEILAEEKVIYNRYGLIQNPDGSLASKERINHEKSLSEQNKPASVDLSNVPDEKIKSALSSAMKSKNPKAKEFIKMAKQEMRKRGRIAW